MNKKKCYIGNKNWKYSQKPTNSIKVFPFSMETKKENDLTRRGLFNTFNNKNNNNTKAFKQTIEKLKDLDYKF